MFVALYDYDKRFDEDLCFKKGEYLEIIDDTFEKGWWKARSQATKQEGLSSANANLKA